MELVIASVLFAIILICTFFHLFLHYRRAGKLIDKIPGPRHFPIIGNSLDLVIPHEALWKLLREYAAQYYPIYKFWICHLPVVNIRHPNDIEILLSSQKHIQKSDFYKFLEPWLNTGLLTATGIKWRMRRKTLTPAFHYNLLQEFVDAFNEISEETIKLLKADDDDVVVNDIVQFFAQHSLNAICETAMGTALQKDNPLQIKYREGVRQMGDILYYRSTRPWLNFNWIFSMTEQGRLQTESLKVLHYFTTKLISERKTYHKETGGNGLKMFLSKDETIEDDTVPAYDKIFTKKRLAMLDLLIAVQQQHKNIDDLGIREEVDTFIFAGHDTTTIGISFAILLLAEHKEIQERVRKEINSVLSQSNGKFGINELQNMTYLDRCIKESLRLFPPVPLISRNITEDLHLTNYIIPSGSMVNIHIYDLHRDPNFWSNPLVYDPDRFLPERIKNRHPFSYVPFSAGSRNCIGQKFAMLEIKSLVVHTLRNFYLESQNDWTNIRILPDLVLKTVEPLIVKFIPIKG